MQTTKRKTGGGLALANGATSRGVDGRFVEGEGLTEQQRQFVIAYVSNGGNGRQAAAVAGYSFPDQSAHNLRRNPAVSSAIRAELSRQIEGGASLGWAVMRELMTDAATSPQVRFQAAKWSLEAAGHGLQAALGAARLGIQEADKPLSEMSMSEIEQFVERSQAALSALRSVSAPSIDVPSVQTSTDTETTKHLPGSASLPQ